jgi:transposase
MLNIIGVKSCDLITVPLGIPDVKVPSSDLNERGDVIITVESTQAGTVCQHCGRKITKFHGHDRWIELRHLPILGRRTSIRLQPKRYECDSCGGKSTTQSLDWYEPKSTHTKAYDRHLML